MRESADSSRRVRGRVTHSVRAGWLVLSAWSGHSDRVDNEAIARLTARKRALASTAKGLILERIRSGERGDPDEGFVVQVEELRKESEAIDQELERAFYRRDDPPEEPPSGVREPRSPRPGSPPTQAPREDSE
jgi:hypothetical protein